MIILATHISLAVISLILNTYILFRPSEKVFDYSFLALGGVTLSGIALIMTSPGSLAKVCVSGLLYFAFISVTLYVAYHRLSDEKVAIKTEK